MIRNIVFDMGNVLIEYTPDVYARRFAQTEADAGVLKNEIFYSPEWMALDAGAISIGEALERIRARLPARLHVPAGEVIHRWHERIVPIDEMTALARRAKEKGLRVYLLSNANTAFDLYKESLPVYPLLDGFIVSAFEKLVKPDAAIYRLMMDRFGLRADETVFVDDTAVNVEGAVACGWKGVCFDRRDVEGLTRALAAWGVDLG